MALTGIIRYQAETRFACFMMTSSDCRTAYQRGAVLVIPDVCSPSNGADKTARLGRIEAQRAISGLHGCPNGCIFSTFVCQVYVSLTSINPKRPIEYIGVFGCTAWMSPEGGGTCGQRFALRL